MPMREDPGLFAVATPPPAMRDAAVVSGVTEVGLVGAHPPQAMSKVAARSSGGIRRSPRLIRKKELSACASDQDLILMLKRENKALKALQKERITRDGLLDGYMVGMQAAERCLSRMPKPAPEDPPPKVVAKVPAPAGSGKKRKKVVKTTLPQEVIDWYILNQHTNPWKSICDELDLGKRSQTFRENYAEEQAIWNKHDEYAQAIIKQYRTKGYAEDYKEVTDSSDDDDN